MKRPRRSLARRLFALGLAAFALLLGGCVYLRLLEFKLQLNKFDQNFALRTADGLAIICQKPVIRTGDVRWFGVMPETVQQLGHAEQWQVRWVKQPAPGAPEKIEYDIILDLGFTDDKLARVGIAERYFEVMPKAFLIGVIKSFGRGKIDQSGKSVEAALSSAEVAATRPKLPAIQKLLGAPTEEHVERGLKSLRYRFVPATKESRAGVFDMIVQFDPATGELATWQAVTPVGKLGFNFSSDR
jgi:hypothetical protein